MKINPLIIWTIMVSYFIVWEANGVYLEIFGHVGDKYTFTHFITKIPMGLKVGLIAWIAYHFLWQHPKG